MPARCGDIAAVVPTYGAPEDSVDCCNKSSNEIFPKIFETLCYQEKISVILQNFPCIKKSMLKRVLSECNGNVTVAIDRILDEIFGKDCEQRSQADEKTDIHDSSLGCPPPHATPHSLHLPLPKNKDIRDSVNNAAGVHSKAVQNPSKKLLNRKKLKPSVKKQRCFTRNRKTGPLKRNGCESYQCKSTKEVETIPIKTQTAICSHYSRIETRTGGKVSVKFKPAPIDKVEIDDCNVD